LEGFEADDVIGSISNNLNHQAKIEKYIVTGDKDTLQLVNDNTKVFTLGRGINDPILFDEQKVIDKFKIKPDQVVDYKALRGDPSDNIPGVAGVGDKTATSLILEYGDLENVYKNLDKITSKALKKKLAENKEKAFLSQELAEIKQDLEINFDLEKTARKDFDGEKFRRFLIGLEFKSLLKRFFPVDQRQSPEAPKIEGYKDVRNKSDWEYFKKKVQKTKKIALYFNKNENGKLSEVGAVLKDKEIESYFLKENLIENLKDVFRSEKILKIGYDLKINLREFIFKAEKEKKDFLNNFFDIQLSAYLIKSGASNKLEKLIFEEFGEELKYQTTQKGQASLLIDNSKGQEKELIEKAFWIYKLYEEYQNKLNSISVEQIKENSKKGNLRKLLEQLENPLTKILAKMEFWGIAVNEKIFQQTSQEAQTKIEKLEKEIFDLAGEEFNINSPSQLGKILYEKLEISTENIKKGKTGFSTDANQLKKMENLHPIIAKIEKYRELFKLKTTYADSLPKLVEEDGRIHTTFNQTVTATGRLSSSEPNLQNIPRKGDLAQKIRSAFIAPEGKKMVAVDYSQIDLRVAAHVSSDRKMIDIFENDKDIHQTTAAWVNGLDLNQITKEQRKEAKSLNFGVLYGMGVYGFMQDSGVSRKRAEFFIEQYMKNFSDLKSYLDKTKEFARENGFVETEMGRRRYVKGINSSNFQLKNAAERVAINLPIQGLAADIMKKSMIDVDEKVLSKYSENQVKMILQVHDELIFEVKEDLVDVFISEIKLAMEETYKLKVPLKVEFSVGENWGEL
jgi:DNA polymerase-1